MSGTRRYAAFVGVTGLLAAAIPAASAAVVAPYVNDFTVSADDFVLSQAGGGWTLDTSDSGTLGHHNTNGTGATLFAAAVQVDGLGGPADQAGDFVVSGTFSAGKLVGSFDYYSVVALSNADGFNSSTDSFYMFRHLHNQSQQLELYRIAGGNSERLIRIAAENIAVNTPYTITLTGTYIDTDNDQVNDALKLVGTVSRGSESWTLEFTDESPLTGSYFGMRDQNANNGAEVIMSWDSFSVVPEPAAGASVLILGTLLRRRRSR